MFVVQMSPVPSPGDVGGYMYNYLKLDLISNIVEIPNLHTVLIVLTDDSVTIVVSLAFTLLISVVTIVHRSPMSTYRIVLFSIYTVCLVHQISSHSIISTAHTFNIQPPCLIDIIISAFPTASPVHPYQIPHYPAQTQLPNHSPRPVNLLHWLETKIPHSNIEAGVVVMQLII